MEYEDIDRLRNEYLEKYIYAGLTNLNTGFDSPLIWYFSREDFEILLDRVEAAGLGIYGIEPWKDGEYYDVWTCDEFECEPTDPTWYRMAFDYFDTLGLELQYAASYYVPIKLLE
jgi:hypothetical protein